MHWLDRAPAWSIEDRKPDSTERQARQSAGLVGEFEVGRGALVGRQSVILKPDLSRYRRIESGPPRPMVCRKRRNPVNRPRERRHVVDGEDKKTRARTRLR